VISRVTQIGVFLSIELDCVRIFSIDNIVWCCVFLHPCNFFILY